MSGTKTPKQTNKQKHDKWNCFFFVLSCLKMAHFNRFLEQNTSCHLLFIYSFYFYTIDNWNDDFDSFFFIIVKVKKVIHEEFPTFDVSVNFQIPWIDLNVIEFTYLMVQCPMANAILDLRYMLHFVSAFHLCLPLCSICKPHVCDCKDYCD